jgi:hypothetical protein
MAGDPGHTMPDSCWRWTANQISARQPVPYQSLVKKLGSEFR